jgi:hypothetical protein
MSNALLLLNPEEYAKRAIAALESQLGTAISSSRKVKITSRIALWKKTLEVLNEENAKKENVENQQSESSK